MAYRPPHNGGQYSGYNYYGDPHRQQQAPNPSGGGYPGGGGYHPSAVSTMFPPNTDRVIMDLFHQADCDGSGTIDELELGRLLSEGRETFPPRTLRLMLHLFADTPDTTRIGRQGFVNLWRALSMWHAMFMEYDHNKSGTIDKAELQQALSSFHFPIPPQVLDILMRKYNRMGSNNSIRVGVKYIQSPVLGEAFFFGYEELAKVHESKEDVKVD